jgi:ABC-2 type transport system permease protein
VSLLWHQLRAEQLIFWRNRESAVFIFIFPLLLFVLLASLYDGDLELDGVDYAARDVLLAGMIGYGAANTAFAGLAITLVIRREYGILKRLRSTPLPAPTYLVAVLCSAVLVFALQVAALFSVGALAYDTSTPEQIGSVAVLVVLGVLAFAGLGIGAAALIRSGEGASAVLNVILLPMAFLSGAFGSRDYPAALEAIANVLPLKYYIDLVYAAYLQNEPIWSDPLAIGVVAAWGLAGAAVGARRFGWEPRER